MSTSSMKCNDYYPERCHPCWNQSLEYWINAVTKRSAKSFCYSEWLQGLQKTTKYCINRHRCKFVFENCQNVDRFICLLHCSPGVRTSSCGEQCEWWLLVWLYHVNNWCYELFDHDLCSKHYYNRCFPLT